MLDALEVTFPVSGVETYLWLPVVVGFAVSFFTSMAGVSGAFLLLPFQLSVLGFVNPAVSSTNLVFNLVAIPGGVYRYLRERRMVWPLAGAVIAGTLPGVFLGAWIRVTYLPEPGRFKAFVGCVLLYLAVRLIAGLIGAARGAASATRSAPGAGAGANSIAVEHVSLRRLAYSFRGQTYSASVPLIFTVAAAVGVIGGTYGIGGGAIIAPFFVAICRLPVHTVAGAALLGTFVTSVAGVLFYQAIAPGYAASGLAVAPDWALGALFGLGGLAGTYLGARVQRFVPARWLELMLAGLLSYVSLRYLLESLG